MTPEMAYDVAFDIHLAVCEDLLGIDTSDGAKETYTATQHVLQAVEGALEEYVEHPPLPEPDPEAGQRAYCCANPLNLGTFKGHCGNDVPFCKRCGRTGKSLDCSGARP